MKKSDQLKQDRTAKLAELDALIKLKEGDQSREWSADEQKKFDDGKAALETLKKAIETALDEEKIQLELANARMTQEPPTPAVHTVGAAHSKDAKTLAKSFSLTKAIAAQARGRSLEGAEAEMYREAEIEVRTMGQELEGQVAIPSQFLDLAGVDKRADMSVGAATYAGNTVATDLTDFFPILRPRLLTASMGATTLTGLRGNIDMIRQDAKSSGAWEGEVDENAQGNPTMQKFSLSPKRYGVTATVSKQLLAQTSFTTEAFLRQDLESAIREGVDLACINGSGASNQPTGFLNIAGINTVALDTNGRVPTYNDLIQLETELALDNSDMGNLGFMTTPGIRGLLKTTKLDAGSGLFVWQQGSSQLNGYRAEVSTQVPSTLTKGTSSGNCHAIIFGDWSSVIIANWAGLDIVVDPYSTKKTAQIEITMNSWWDFNLRYLTKIAAIKDALLA
jgi:HK97 family phage major capsid protein